MGAKFRQQVATQAAPRQWTYLDVLGRAVMKAGETFNAGVSDQDVAAVCTDYEATGKPKRVSNPFFLPGTAGAEGPGGLEGVCAAPARQWTVTSFDVLGRPTQVLAPDGSQVRNSYAGLSTQYSYAADGNLSAVSRDADAGTIVNLTTLDNQSYTATTQYDALGRPWKSTGFLIRSRKPPGCAGGLPKV